MHRLFNRQLFVFAKAGEAVTRAHLLGWFLRVRDRLALQGGTGDFPRDAVAGKGNQGSVATGI